MNKIEQTLIEISFLIPDLCNKCIIIQIMRIKNTMKTISELYGSSQETKIRDDISCRIKKLKNNLFELITEQESNLSNLTSNLTEELQIKFNKYLQVINVASEIFIRLNKIQENKQFCTFNSYLEDQYEKIS